jgi:hypothetical protein
MRYNKIFRRRSRPRYDIQHALERIREQKGKLKKICQNKASHHSDQSETERGGGGRRVKANSELEEMRTQRHVAMHVKLN